MSATNGDDNGRGHGASAVAAARPVVLIRYRPGRTGETARAVHLVPLPVGGETGAASALCGALLRPEEIERVRPGQGMPCSLCTLSHVAASPPPPPARAEEISVEAGPLAAAASYQGWGWPVTLRRDQIWLALDHDVVALVVPALLAVDVAAILSTRRCPPLVLAHPYAPEHRVLLAGERYGVALPWPLGVCRITGNVLLPPTLTARGPVTWVHPPRPDALRLSREIDLIAALRTAASNPSPSAGGQPAPPH
ncbi:MAG: hypothetical protein ACRDSG_04250 [Pseudonocardiaceae bacterium]